MLGRINSLPTILVAAGFAGILGSAFGADRETDDNNRQAALANRSDNVARGEYLVQAGDCISCHTVRAGQPFAGGYAIVTGFGTLYSPNITPDAETGIGKWSANDFWSAMHEGKSKDGTLLYPAFPYTNYTKILRADSDAIFDYLRSLKPVRRVNREHELRFPYNQRKLLVGWRTLYFTPSEYEPDATRSQEWNRGAYLVQGLGHCDACHTSRNMLGAVNKGEDLSGGLLPASNWYAPSLTSSREAGLGDWEINDLTALLKTGVSSRGAVYGPMAAVVQNSLQHLTLGDIRAIAVYLKTLGQEDAAADQQAEEQYPSGAKIYDTHCKACHRSNGAGMAPAYPPLAKNQSITMRSTMNPIRMVLNGGFPPGTQSNPRPYGMPQFGHLLNDQEVAAVVTYIRQSWGNRASAVPARDVAAARAMPSD